jgi:hypothetical protein
MNYFLNRIPQPSKNKGNTKDFVNARFSSIFPLNRAIREHKGEERRKLFD